MTAPSSQVTAKESDIPIELLTTSENVEHTILQSESLEPHPILTLSSSEGLPDRSTATDPSFHQSFQTSSISPPFLAKLDSAGEIHENSARWSPKRDRPNLNFEIQDLVPMPNADEILDRWTRPYLNKDPAFVLKTFHPFTVQYTIRVLKSYVARLKSSAIPPFIHHQQVSGGLPQTLSICFSLVHSWLNRNSGNENMIKRKIAQEMRSVHDQVH
jgi:hypothetical protein